MGSLDERRLRDLLLVALALSMGALDAVSWLALGKVYSAFQTGNIVVLGFGLAGAPGPPVFRAAVSLAAFAVGALVASRLVAPDPPDAVWTRRVTRVLAAVAVAQAAFLVLWLAVDARPSDTSADELIAIGSFAGGMQTGAIFSLEVRGVFTTAATATWTALMADLARGSRTAGDLGRLAGVVLAIVAGAAAGGVLMVYAPGTAPVLPLAVTVTVVAMAALRLGHPQRVRARS
jgi:uncharacterized membrane protein YoaK (UPF0700 family)